jgi:sodium/bile acid cotransporter 7
MARGNVAAAVCAGSFSNLLGILATPLLAALLLGTGGGGFSVASLLSVGEQLLLPFAAGQLLRRWIGGWVSAHAKLVQLIDRGSILLVVYTAFSGAVVGGVWSRIGALDLARLLVICGLLLAIVLAATFFTARALRFAKPDEIAIVFCGSKKSLASGVPMAGVLFPAATAGLALLPLMLFHQIQLMACAVIAQRYANRADLQPVSG